MPVLASVVAYPFTHTLARATTTANSQQLPAPSLTTVCVDTHQMRHFSDFRDFSGVQEHSNQQWRRRRRVRSSVSPSGLRPICLFFAPYCTIFAWAAAVAANLNVCQKTDWAREKSKRIFSPSLSFLLYNVAVQYLLCCSAFLLYFTVCTPKQSLFSVSKLTQLQLSPFPLLRIKQGNGVRLSAWAIGQLAKLFAERRKTSSTSPISDA